MKHLSTITKIIILSYILRMSLAMLTLSYFGEEPIFSNDSKNFLTTGQNLTLGRGFTKDTSPPFSPEAHFPPIYPLLIAGSIKLSGGVIPLVAFQIILSSLIPLLIWEITGFLTSSKRVRIFASILSAVEPLTIIFSVMILTEVISVFFILLSILLFLKFIYHHKNQHIILSGVTLGISVLTRPHGQFLVILALLFLLTTAIINKATRKKTLLGLASFLLFYVATISPWLMRNHRQFDSYSISTTGLRNVYTSIVPAVISLRDGTEFDEAQSIAYANLEKKYGYTRKDILERPELGKILVKEGLETVRSNIKVTSQVFLIAINAFFTQDLYYSYGVRFHLIPRFTTGFSPSVILLKEGPIALYNTIKGSVGWYGLIPLAGRIFWISINLLMLIGFLVGVRKKETRFMTIFLLIIILYYAGTSSIAAFSDHGRFRLPASGFMYALAGLGFWSLADKLGLKLRTKV